MYKHGVNESVLYERGVNVSYTTIALCCAMKKGLLVFMNSMLERNVLQHGDG